MCVFLPFPQPPTLITNQILYINSGETAVISRSILHISDLDNPQDVFITVLDPPQHGHLTHVHGDVQVTHFKLEDLDREQLQYVHDGSEGDQDRFLLQVNDGHNYQNILFYISIAQKVQTRQFLLFKWFAKWQFTWSKSILHKTFFILSDFCEVLVCLS